MISYVNGGLTVDRAALTVPAGNVFKHYDVSPWSGTVGVTYDGLQGGDTAASLQGRLTLSGTAFGAVDPGQYVITASGLSSQNYRMSLREGALWIAAPAHRLATRPPMTEKMPRFHLRMFEHDITQTRITAAWAQATCVLDPADKASIEVSNVPPGRKEHIHTSAVCPPGAGRPRQAWNARTSELSVEHVLQHLRVQCHLGHDFLSRKLRPWSGRWWGIVPPSAQGRSRAGMIERLSPGLWTEARCRLQSISRASFYREPGGYDGPEPWAQARRLALRCGESPVTPTGRYI